MSKDSRAQSLRNLAKLQKSGDLARAEAAARGLLREDPNDAETSMLLAGLLRDRGDLVGAEKFYRRVLELVPSNFDARLELGLVLFQRGVPEEAVVHFREAVLLRPKSAIALRNYGALLRIGQRVGEAIEVLERALEQAPHDAATHTYLGSALSLRREPVRAMVHLRKAVEYAPEDLAFHDNLLLLSHYQNLQTREQLAELHRAYGLVVEAGTKRTSLPIGPRSPERRLRIGYVSADFVLHSVAFFLEPLLEHRDRTQFEAYVYSNARKLDAVSTRLQGFVDGWRDVNSLSDDDAAALIRADEIDVLIDLSGHTNGNRLAVFARKPAPVQITYLGYPNTTGLSCIDYRLTDAECDPPGSTESLHTERLLRLDTGFLCYGPPTFAPEVSVPPSSTGRPPTFGSFNALNKLSDETLALWARLLRETPEARLLLKHSFLGQPESKARFEALLQAHGLPLERVELLGHVPALSGHLSAYGAVDVALDSFPYHGTTTTCEALYMGVPVVSLAGDTHVSRVGVSLLKRAGLSDLVATDHDAYVRIAQDLLRDEARRVALRATMRERLRGGGLTDAPRVTRAFEDALRYAYESIIGDAGAPDSARPAAWKTPLLAVPLPDRQAVWRTFGGGLRIASPAGVKTLLGYRLEEQGDRSEDELRFVCKVLSEGDVAVDAGANHGLYALPMARAVGPSGRVLAIEPQPLFAGRLRASAVANRLSQLTVLEAAVSSEEGRASFDLDASPESDSPSVGSPPQLASVDVRVTTLDRGLSEAGLAGVSFVKLDVGGAEVDALEGATELLARDQPLVMVERQHANAANVGLFERLSALGYGAYRLVPGLQLLCPHPPGGDPDTFSTRVFGASAARAQRLEQAGSLAREFAAERELPGVRSYEAVLPKRLLARQPDLRRGFDVDTPGARAHRGALEHFALAQQPTLAPSVRVFALRRAVELALASIDSPTELSRLMTLARVAWAWGRRSVTLEALETAFAVAKSKQVRVEEPFLAACPRYDDLDPGGRLGDWCVSAILEQLEQLRAPSSFYTPNPAETVSRLEVLVQHGQPSPEMSRRLLLLRGARA